MISELKPYANYKESGLPWLGPVPRHWETRRLRHACDMRVSNVDKHTKLGETPIRLCNYVEVYKNERIRESTRFMKATASEDERIRFCIRNGDVLITKDSEQWNDIGVPALVEFEAPDLVCGYHLAILRSRPGLEGPFLHRALQCHYIAAQFHVEANGVTRYGLSHGAIQGIAIPLAPPAEQAAIVRFLDWANGRLERAIRAKRKVIALLNEQKQAIIHRAVTRGVDPSVPLKPSGIPWLGDIPAHWDVLPLRGVLIQRKEKNDPIKTTNILSLSLSAGVTLYADKKPGGNKAKEDLSAYMLAYPGDIVLNSMNVVVGSVGLSKYFGAVSPVYYMLHPRRADDLVEFFDAIFQARSFQRSLFGLGNGIMVIQSKSTGKLNTIRMRIPMTKLRRVQLPCPEPKEQAAIVEYIAEARSHFDNAINASLRELDLLREYRTRLVADVVTGKLDVREAAARLPEEAPPDTFEDDTELSEETEPADEATAA
jgi:type I restriction enzyme S subunit